MIPNARLSPSEEEWLAANCKQWLLYSVTEYLDRTATLNKIAPQVKALAADKSHLTPEDCFSLLGHSW